jgi:uncharacterized phage-associated protein
MTVVIMLLIMALKTKTSQFLAYIIQNNPNVSITSLMKLSYLTDLVSIGKLNKKISDFEYRRYKYGPFDKKIYEYLKCLIKKNMIIEDSGYTNTGEEFITYKYNEKIPIFFDKLCDDEINVANGVLETLRGYGAKALTELTYKTKPMKKIGAILGSDIGLNKKLDLRTE